MADVHVFQGLRRDNHPINQDSKFLWDAHNVRLTARNGNSQLSVTSELGTKVEWDGSVYSNYAYIGHATIGNYLILFLHNEDGSNDLILRFESSDIANPIVLYTGDLSLSNEHPLQTVSDYEAELIQKVYWTDGINRPRVINIAKPELLEATYGDDGYTSIYTDAPFDFVQDLALNEEVTIERSSSSSGLFAAGVIQYAFTYCYKYGQETNIFYTSELLYTAHSDRGGSAEDTVACAFNINIDNIEGERFDYLRVYSIQRTSLNGEAITKRVVDINLEGNPTSVTFTDTGTTGESVDSNYLLYIGGKDIVAGCIHAKDNVLFLGDITYNRIQPDGDDIKDYFSAPVENIVESEEEEETDEEITTSLKLRATSASGETDNTTVASDFTVTGWLTTFADSSGITSRGFELTDEYQDITEAILTYPNICVNAQPIYSTQYVESMSILFYDTSSNNTGTLITSFKVENDNESTTLSTIFAVPAAILSYNYVTVEVKASVADIPEDSDLDESTLILRTASRVSATTDTDSVVTCNTRGITLSTDTSTSNSFYHWVNQLHINTSTFKGNEDYRLGIQFQYKTGEWSEPLWLEDKTMDWSCRPSFDNSTNKLDLPYFNTLLSAEGSKKFYEAGYRKVRGVVVFPEEYEKNVVAQGMVCPTVFQYRSRENNTPFAQSSWFLRPFGSDVATKYSINNLNGNVAEWRHLYPLAIDSGSAEIQNMGILDPEVEKSVETAINNIDFSLNNVKSASDNTIYYGGYYVDHSIDTIHSPDIVFNETTQSIIGTNSTEFSFRIVGAIPFNYVVGDSNINLETVQCNPDAKGVICDQVVNSSNGASGLCAGLFFHDSVIDENKSSMFISDENIFRWWLVYPWQRNGSLNNDINRPSDYGSRTAVLDKKIMSNIRYASKLYWFNPDSATATYFDYGQQQIKVFNFDEVQLLKFQDEKNLKGDISYYGNVDTMNSAYAYWKIMVSDSVDGYIVKTADSDGNAITHTITIDDGTVSDGENSYSFTTMVVSVTGYQFSQDEDDESYGTATYTGTISSVATWGGSEDLTEDVSITIEIYGKGSLAEQITSIKYTNITISTSEVTYENEENTNITGVTVAVTLTKSVGVASSTGLDYIWPSNIAKKNFDGGKIGDYLSSLATPQEAVRIKYKSTPHAVVALNYDGDYRLSLPLWEGKGTASTTITSEDDPIVESSLYWLSNESTSALQYYSISTASGSFTDEVGKNIPDAYLWLCEIYRDSVDNKFGGTSKEALLNNLWLPAGPAVSLTNDGETGVEVQWLWGDTWYQRYDCLKTYPYSSDDTNQVVEIGSFMCETHVNIDGRYDRNRGLVSNLNITNENFNLINDVYSQKNNFFSYRIYDEDYYKVNRYPNQVVWTEVKSPAAYPDEWTNLHMASSLELNGTYGTVTAINSFNDLLIAFQQRATNNILFNSRVQLNPSDGVPIEIANNNTVEGTRIVSNTIGCQDKFSQLVTPMGIYFIDYLNAAMYIYNGSITNLSLQLGSLFWIRDNVTLQNWQYLPTTADFVNSIRICYDPKYQDVYFIPGRNYYEEAVDAREALVYSEQLQQFTSFMSYGGSVICSFNSELYGFAPLMGEDDVVTTYIHHLLQSDITGPQIYGWPREYSISFISNENPIVTKVFDNVEMRADQYESKELLGANLTHVYQDGKPFNYIQAKNEFQDSGVVNLTDATMRKKFRVWRAQIPRNEGTRQRIRNPWALITLGHDPTGETNTSLILHHLNVLTTVS